MNQTVKLIIVNIVVTIILLVGIETLCYFFVPHGIPSVGFLIRTNHFRTGDLQHNTFNQVDPLLGYTQTEARLRSRGYNVEYGMPVFYTTYDTNLDFNIFITGGSTSDVWFDSQNWPVQLVDILKENGIKAKVFAAGMGGWTSGQELLRLLRDGLDTRPTIHVSYSGYNDVIDPAYVSGYEMGFFEKEFQNHTTSWIMPNTVLFFKNLFRFNHRDSVNDLMLHYETRGIPCKFWERNCSAMFGIAVQYNYHFAGFLQPAMCSGKLIQPIVPGYEHYAEKVKNNYYDMKKVASQHSDFLTDLSGIFDTCTGKVFRDDCHLIDESRQKLVALHVYNTLLLKGFFNKPNQINN